MPYARHAQGSVGEENQEDPATAKGKPDRCSRDISNLLRFGGGVCLCECLCVWTRAKFHQLGEGLCLVA